MTPSLSRIEQETIITFNESEPTATVYTFNRALQSRLNKMVSEHPKLFLRRTDLNGFEGSELYEIPKDRIKVIAPTSEARREAARRNAANLAGRHNTDKEVTTL